MKWIYLLLLIIGTPALTAFLRAHQRYLPHFCFVLGVSMFVLAPTFWIAPIAWPGWAGPVQGIEISFIDGASIALLLSTKRVRTPLSLVAAMMLICFAIVVSTFGASQPEAAAFYAWQLFRSVLLFSAVARVCGTNPAASVALIAGLALGIFYEGAFCVYQFATGVFRPGGNMGHSNFLGLSSEFVIPPVFALMLGTKRFAWPAVAVLSGFCIAVLGGSRATAALFVAGLALTLLFSVMQNVSSRKIAFGATAALLVLVSVPALLWQIDYRSEASKEDSSEVRSAMNQAARMIVSDYPFGVGANQYVLVANLGGYSQRAGVPWNSGNRAAPVHNTYYLVVAELGFIGIFGFVWLIGSCLVLGLRLLRRPSAYDGSAIVPGLIATFVILSVHITYEYVFMYMIPHYLFAITAGLLVANIAWVRAKAPQRRTLPARGAPLSAAT